MKTLKNKKIFNIKNINILNRYKRVFSFCGIKIKVKNKEKIEFYKNKQKELILKKYNEKYKNIIDELNKHRKNVNPILTIILITYNHVETIEKCIQSLINQNTKYNYIIKICDDASTDGTSDICLEYAKKYPEKIEYILQSFNTNGKHAINAIKNIDSSYWCFIDGDDCWLTDNKIESALNFLESHHDYVIYATDFLYKSATLECSHSHTYQHLSHGNQDISFDNYVYLHPSSRIHRNIINWSKDYPKSKNTDYYFYILSLAKGKCYFNDTITSVWNFNKKGMYSSYSDSYRAYVNAVIDFYINYLLDFKFDYFFSEKQKQNLKHLKKLKSFLGKRLGWGIALILLRKDSIAKEIKLCKAPYDKFDKKNNVKEMFYDSFKI